MNQRLSLSLRRPARRLALATLALLLLTATARSASARVVDSSDRDPAPPSYAVPDHVRNGCHLSTIAFLTRFRADYPQERGEPVILNLRGKGGASKGHTVALVTWHGSWWCRDEYFGVIPLGRKVGAALDSARLAERLQTVLERRSHDALRRPGAERPPPPETELTPAEQLHEVVTATRIIPLPSRIFWIGEGSTAVPVAFFRPDAGQIALYDPVHGTCLAECSLSDDIQVVRLVAGRLGYDPRSVHPGADPAHGTLVAAADNAPSSLAR